jgi:hypothetical protein
MGEKLIGYMTEEEILNIPERHLPLAVLSSTVTSPFAFGIINVRKSIWNHFMWMHKPGYFASQGFTYSEVPVKKYFGFDHRLKFWRNPNWSEFERQSLIAEINRWLSKPAFSTRYDFLAILGQFLKIAWLQNPATKICSDYGSLLRDTCIDLEYNLKYPAPDQVDNWFNDHSKYEVYGRYAGE